MSTKAPTKRPLTLEEQQCAERLRAVYERVKAEKKISQAWLGEAMGISQSAVGQYLNGAIPLNLEAKIKFAATLGCDLADIDPDALKPFFKQDELRLISAYRMSDPDKKKTILGVAELASNYAVNNKPTPQTQEAFKQSSHLKS